MAGIHCLLCIGSVFRAPPRPHGHGQAKATAPLPHRHIPRAILLNHLDTSTPLIMRTLVHALYIRIAARVGHSERGMSDREEGEGGEEGGRRYLVLWAGVSQSSLYIKNQTKK